MEQMNDGRQMVTDDGTEYVITGGRVVIPTPEHEHGGGVDLREKDASEIVAGVIDGETSGENRNIEWEYLGTKSDTRVGPSKEIRVTRSIFSKERSVTLTLVDLADLELVARDA